MSTPCARATDPSVRTIAHGFLTLSLLSHLFASTFSFEGRNFGVNYGLNKVRFTAPLPRAHECVRDSCLARLTPLPDGGIEHAWNVTVEREGRHKPVLVAEWLLRNH
jgi:acyl dehydratase